MEPSYKNNVIYKNNVVTSETDQHRWHPRRDIDHVVQTICIDSQLQHRKPCHGQLWVAIVLC